MSFVPGFQYDIFISYAHNDNAPIGNAKGWVDELHESLENWLGKRRGIVRLSIWRDKALDGNTDFNLTIQNRLDSTALLFVLHSRNYEASAYCLKELKYFCDFWGAKPGGLHARERLRIVHVLLNNIAHTEWQKDLKAFGEASGFPMHDAQSSAERGDLTSVSSTLFETQLRKVVDAVEATLRDMATDAQPPAPVDEPPTAPAVRIFIADTADELKAVRDRVIADLDGHAVTVADVPPPLDTVSHRRRVTDALTTASLSLHLLDGNPGRAVVDDPALTYPRAQLDIALGTPIAKLIWVPEDLAVESVRNDAQRNLLNRLESGDRGTNKFEFVRSSRVALSELLLQKVGTLTNRVAPANQTFLVDTHQKDQRYAYKLADLLSDKGADVAFNRESLDPTESLANFQRAITEVRNLIVMFGRVGVPWVKRRIQAALKVVAQQFESESPASLEAIWVCLLPENSSPAAFRMPTGIVRINLLDNTRSEAIEPAIVEQLLKAGA